MKKIVVATSNKGKLKEFSQILSDYVIISMKDAGFKGEIEETGKTFRENAYLKAKTVADSLGVPALADDSGLCVNALGGAPGIYSARYSEDGTDKSNRELLLKNMKGLSDRTAKFICVLCYVEPCGKVIYAEGETYGKILESEQGSAGFGYDPVFFSDDLNKSMGEALPDEKNSVSHRARAIFAIKDKL
ncbi:MAG: RdgB/HAM1 family non-canonical purine NTP pyrophosphatase [Clostridia bacterium]|nr:RdgB/HAM1 family non-canonical purine NTP pyrophosphatase [Clostridia bacterium]